MNKFKHLVIFNTCGINKKDNSKYYINAISNILNQNQSDIRIVLSDCCTDCHILDKLHLHFKNDISYNFIKDKHSINITQNLTIKKCIESFGIFDTYTTIDSGVDFQNNKNVLSILIDTLNSDEKILCVSPLCDNDNGEGEWAFKPISYNKPNINFLPPGSFINKHVYTFKHEFIDKYNQNIAPDVFLGNGTEGIYTYMVLCLMKYFCIVTEKIIPKLRHARALDGPNQIYGDNPKWVHDCINIDFILNEGSKFGLGFNEIKRPGKHTLNHNTELYDTNGFLKDINMSNALYDFIKTYLFIPKDYFDYDKINYEFII